MNDKAKQSDETFKILTDLIDEVFSNHYNKDKKMETQTLKTSAREQTSTQVYESIEDYTAQTGKRFRMTKDQKQRSLSRDEAFNETFGGKN
tara:strand:- start:20 stop:292 length:273 start_codon:yes stop_codon:yes gene_type:complete